MVVGFRRHPWKEPGNDRQDVPNLVDIEGIRQEVRETVECEGEEAMEQAMVYRLHWNP